MSTTIHEERINPSDPFNSMDHRARVGIITSGGEVWDEG